MPLESPPYEVYSYNPEPVSGNHLSEGIKSWFNKEEIKLSEKYNFIFVSIDSPKITYVISSMSIE